MEKLVDQDFIPATGFLTPRTLSHPRIYRHQTSWRGLRNFNIADVTTLLSILHLASIAQIYQVFLNIQMIRSMSEIQSNQLQKITLNVLTLLPANLQNPEVPSLRQLNPSAWKAKAAGPSAWCAGISPETPSSSSAGMAAYAYHAQTASGMRRAAARFAAEASTPSCAFSTQPRPARCADPRNP